MNKYYFVNIGAEVIWHPVNSGEQKVMQVCVSVPHPVEDDTPVSLIFPDKISSFIHLYKYSYKDVFSLFPKS